MSVNAFGIDHGVVSKADEKNKPMSAGRTVSTALFAPIHGAVAGKKGKKGRAVGNEIGGALAGNIAGTAAGALMRSPELARGLGSAGSLGGAVAGGARNQRKGYLKPEGGVHKAFDKTKSRRASDKKLRGTVSRAERIGAGANGALYTAQKAPRGKRTAAYREHVRYLTDKPNSKGTGVGVRRPGLTHRGAYAHTKQVQGW
jgi:hypothetical protein